MIYLAVLLGVWLFWLFQLNTAFVLPDFKWRVFFKTNWIPTLINLTVALILILSKAEIMESFLNASLVGFAGQVIWKKIADAFDPNIKTYIGLK